MRILALADVPYSALYGHFERSRWPDVQLVIGCGDLPGEYLDFVATSLGAPLVYVRGNHDVEIRTDGGFGGDDIDGRLVSFRGLRLLGFEGSAWYGGKGVEYHEREMTYHVWRTYPALWWTGGVDIVVSHASPALSADCAPAVALEENVLKVADLGKYRQFTSEDGPVDAAHQGFGAFNGLIAKFRPRLWLHGHNHLNYSRAARVRRLGDTLVANAYEHLLLEIEPRGRTAKTT